MFATFIGRRATALATTLAVVVGLAITPAFTATAAEGDEPVVAEQSSTEVLPETAPPAGPAVAEPPADSPAAVELPAEEAPAEELPVEQEAGPVDEAAPPASPGLMRSKSAAQGPSLMSIQPAGILPASIPTQTVGQTIDIQFATTAAHDSWNISYLSGIGFDTSSTSDGKLTGTLDFPGTRVLRVEAVKQVGVAWEVVASQEYTFDVLLAVTTTSLPDATVGIDYSETLTATRSFFPFFWGTFSITEGSLPPGISLNGNTGELSGTVMSIPASPATYDFAVVFHASVFIFGNYDSAPQPLSITVGYPAPEITTTTLSVATVGSAYATPPMLADGDGTITWSATGLPAGLALDSATGIISGSPDYNSTYGATATVTVMVTANNGRDSAPQALDVVVDTPAPLFGATRLPAAAVGVLYDQVLPLSYAYGDLEYELVQASVLPAGLQLTADGRIYGTPDHNPTAGASKAIVVTVRVDGTAGWDRTAFTFDLLTPAMTLSASTVNRGGSLTVSGNGYLPGDTLEFWLHSTPVLLGTVTAANGAFTSTVVIPANTPAGQHHLEVLGAQSGSQSVPLTVALPPAAPQSTPQSTRSQSQQLTVIPADETVIADAGEIEEQSPAEEEADELPTLNKPMAEGETTAVVPANWAGLITAGFVLLLAALAGWFLLWRRGRVA